MNRQIRDEAAEWFVELNTDGSDPEARRRFDEWLRASPAHLAAFLSMIGIWEDGASVALHNDLTAEELVSWARAGDNVRALTSPANTASMATGTGSRPRMARRHGAIAAGMLIALIAMGSWYLRHFPAYSTQVGEQRSLELADGSIVELNALSEIRVHFSAQQRTVDLLRGQALFRVSKDPARAFVVNSHGAHVRAVGTQFDVDQRSSGTVVTVLEGHVAVWPGEASTGPAPSSPAVPSDSTSPITAQPGELLLGIGEQVVVHARAASAPVKADLGAVTAWRQRQLVFNKASLRDVVDDFNRYNVRPLRIDDERLRDLVISGVFSSTDPSSLIRFLRAQPGIEIVGSPAELRVIARPTPAQ